MLSDLTQELRAMTDQTISTTERGLWGEQLAMQALEAHGYAIIQRNWRAATGEIDIVACEDGMWVFVEVKTRSSEAFETPEEAVTPEKEQRLYETGLLYLAEHELGEVGWRIDVVAITLGESGKVRRLTIYKDAVRVRD
jgi:putative endonuclease